jgi:glycosyltransferase involved in cell wall biosynthesis
MQKLRSEITIGIPCYNAAATLETTLKSIEIQTIEPFEIIIVDDGSTDDYTEILKRHTQVKYIKLEKNMGIGYVRQYLFDVCRSNYITVVDADDSFLTCLALEYMDQDVKKYQPEFLITKNIRQAPVKGIYYEVKGVEIWTHGKVYNIDFLKKHNIKVLPLRSHEDIALNLHILKYCKATHGNYFVYLWRQNPNSITTQSDLAYKYFDDLIEVAKYHYEKGVRTIFLMSEILYFEWERAYEKYGENDSTVQYNKKRLIEYIGPYVNNIKEFLKTHPQQYEEFLKIKGPDYDHIQKTPMIDFLEKEFK